VSNTFRNFCEVVQKIAETRRTSEKVSIFTQYLRQLVDEKDVALAVRFIGEGAMGAKSVSKVFIGHHTISKLAAEYCEIDYEKVFRPSKTATGSSSETIEKLFENIESVRGKRKDIQLHLHDIDERFQRLSNLRKKVEKESSLTEIWSELSPLEVKYFIRIMGSGSLRIGFETRSILSAIAQCYNADPEKVRYTHMLTGSLEETVIMSKNANLDEAEFQLYQPIAFMLASPYDQLTVDNISEYVAEEKFDGMRCQIHVGEQGVKLFSRDLNEITDSFPEVERDFEVLKANSFPDCLLDGELCVFRDNTIQSFQDLQKRMGVKSPSVKILNDYPVVFIAYDILYLKGKTLFNQRLVARRKMLVDLSKTFSFRMVSQYHISDETEMMDFFRRAIQHGNEGLMLKHMDSKYEYGQRKKSWLKVKEPGGSLDVVIIYATAGSGKRGGTYSDFTLGINVMDDERFDQDFIPIGKAYSGYSDEELKRLNVAIKPLIRDRFGPTLSLEPQIVVEIEFDEIQENKRTKAGFTLRFPRFRCIRWEKSPAETDTLAEVRRMYNEKITRLRLPQNENPSFG
jgi:DNA ligase-1